MNGDSKNIGFTRFGYTALGLAQDKGHMEIVDLLSAAGAH